MIRAMILIVRGWPGTGLVDLSVISQAIHEVFNMLSDYPPFVSDDWVIRYVAELNDRDDPYEGPVPAHISQFPVYHLVAVGLDETDVFQYGHDTWLAQEYSLLPATSAPPIIFDKLNGEVIDGFHRVHAALLRGDVTVMAYVGVVDE